MVMIYVIMSSVGAQKCGTVLDEYNNCVTNNCQLWYDGNRLCKYSDNKLECPPPTTSDMDFPRCIDTNYNAKNCPLITCNLYCYNGYAQDENGCDVCVCDPGKVNKGAFSVADGMPCHKNVCPTVTEYSVEGKVGYTTYRFFLYGRSIYNLYAIYGSSDNEMYLPPAYHYEEPYGNNIGGINPYIIHSNPTSFYDSWLTIGLDNGDPNHLLQSVGIDYDEWTINKAFVSKDAAVFMLNPRQQLIKNNHYLIAQLTLDDTKDHTFKINAQGRLTKEDTVKERTWYDNNIIFNIPKGSPSGH
jgi:hypothetical protein